MILMNHKLILRKDEYLHAFSAANAELAVKSMMLKNGMPSIEKLEAFIKASGHLCKICKQYDDVQCAASLLLWSRNSLVTHHERAGCCQDFKSRCCKELRRIDVQVGVMLQQLGDNIVAFKRAL